MNNLIKVRFEELLENDNYKNPDFYRNTYAKNAGWILPQALAYVGKQKAIKNENSFYDGVLTAKSMVTAWKTESWDERDNSGWVKGLLLYLKANPRGIILPATVRATAEHIRPYSALVPLFLAAFKKFQNIPYTRWENIHKIVDDDLYAAMTCSPREFTLEELLECREVGSTIKKGKDQGTVKSPMKATSLNGTGNEEFDALPRLAKVMLGQIWLAHPAYRNEYMILDPNNWDSMPKALIDVELIKEPTEKMPWDD